MFSNQHHRHGSARIATRDMIRRNGHFQSDYDKILLGFLENNGLYFGGQGGLVTIAGARSGKLSAGISYTALGACWDHNQIYLDVKSEIAAISALAVTLRNMHGIYWSPVPQPGAPVQHRTNPTDYMYWGSPWLVDDTQGFVNNFVQKSGGKNGNFFDAQTKRKLEGISIGVTRRDGVMTLPALYEAGMLAMTPSDEWLERVGFYMNLCVEPEFAHVKKIEEEIAQGHADGGNDTFNGIMGGIANSLACLASPALRESLSPYPDGSYDFSFGDLIHGPNKYAVYLCVPQEYLQTWGPVLRSMFVAARIHKSRTPISPPQLWCLDECGNTGGPFPVAVEAFTIGAGLNIKPWAIFQSKKQIANLGENAEHILMSSAQTQQIFGVRDYDTAEWLSKMIGSETLRYDDERAGVQAAHARKQALYAMLNGEDPIAAAMQARQHADLGQTPHAQRRMVRNPDEILNTPAGLQYIFTDGVGAPILGEKRNYYEQPFMAGRYLPNPYHPPADRVKIKTRSSDRWLNFIREPVPDRYAHLPQHKDGFWTRLETIS